MGCLFPVSPALRRPPRAKAIAAVVAIHALLAFVILSGLKVQQARQVVNVLTTLNLREPPPPPPVQPPPKPRPGPPSTSSEVISRHQLATSSQNEMLFIRGKAMSGAPIISGTN